MGNPFEFLGFEPPSEEQMKEAAMKAEARRQEELEFWRELSPAQLVQLRKTYLGAIKVGDPDPGIIAGIYLGICEGLLFGKHEVCVECGVFHVGEISDDHEYGGFD